MSSSYPYDAASESDVRKLKLDVDRLGQRLDDANDRLASWSDKMDDSVGFLEQNLEGLRQEFVDATESTERLNDRITDLERKLSRVDRDVRWLGQRIRGVGNAVLADLDLLVREVTPLAKTAVRGRRAAAQNLGETEIAKLNARIEAHISWRKSWRNVVMDLIQITGELQNHRPGTDYDGDDPDSERTESVRRYRAFAKTIRELAADEERLRNDAHRARDAINADRADREHKRPVVAEGVDANAELRRSLRDSLAEHVSNGAEFPVWFTSSLGHAPGEDVDAWMDVATDLLAYRATYGIDNSLEALGPVPSGQQPEERRTWHTHLAERLRNHL